MDFLLILIPILAVGFSILFIINRRRQKLSPSDIKRVVQQWHSIQTRAESNPNHAVVEADKLIDFVLRKKGFQGSLGEKLKSAAPLFSDINGLWEAHKLRNRVAHEVGVQLSPEQCRGALFAFKKALKDLGVNM